MSVTLGFGGNLFFLDGDQNVIDRVPLFRFEFPGGPFPFPPGLGVPGFGTPSGEPSPLNNPFFSNNSPSPTTSLFDTSSASAGEEYFAKTTLFGSPESIGLGIDGFGDDDTPEDPVMFGGGGSEESAFTTDLIGEEMDMEVLSADADVLDIGALSSELPNGELDPEDLDGLGNGNSQA